MRQSAYPLEQAGGHIHDRIEWQPDAHDEVPKHRIFVDIDKARSLNPPGEHQRREDEGIQRIGDQVKRMETHNDPCGRTIDIGIPSTLQCLEFKSPEGEKGGCEGQADQETAAHCAQILPRRTSVLRVP